jgi:hypothetical protein
VYGNCKVSTGTKVSLMEQNLIDIYDLIEHAIDNAFEGNMNLKFYEYLKSNKIKRHEVEIFIKSTTTLEISNLVDDLNEYIEGGNDNMHKQLREGYGYIPKPQARKIKNYLQNILDDAMRYSNDRRPGRRKKESK